MHLITLLRSSRRIHLVTERDSAGQIVACRATGNRKSVINASTSFACGDALVADYLLGEGDLVQILKTLEGYFRESERLRNDRITRCGGR